MLDLGWTLALTPSVKWGLWFLFMWWMQCINEGRLVCFVLWLWDPQMLQICVLGVFGKSSWQGGGAWALVPWFLDLWCKSSWILDDFVTENSIQFNGSWNFQRNWNVALVLLKRSWWARFNRIYSARVGFMKRYNYKNKTKTSHKCVL